jgi:RNA polymerase sigma-70 factor (ECF subfamily)
MPQAIAPVPSDEELACKAQQGCATSFDTLIRRFQTPVLHFLRHRGLGADAEDVLQETFVRAYTNLDRYRPQWRFATWLFTIARRLCINHARRGGPPAGGETCEAVDRRTPRPDQTAVAAEDHRDLWAVAAAVLSENEYTALWLYYVEDMPARQIAAVLGRSCAAVKTMLHRARRKLLPRCRQWQSDGPASSAAVLPGRKTRPVPVEVPNG